MVHVYLKILVYFVCPVVYTSKLCVFLAPRAPGLLTFTRECGLPVSFELFLPHLMMESRARTAVSSRSAQPYFARLTHSMHAFGAWEDECNTKAEESSLRLPSAYSSRNPLDSH